MRTQRDLAEGIIALGNGTLLIDPAGRAMRGDKRDLPVAGGGANHLAQGAQLVLVLQSLNQRAFVLVRAQIAAFAVGADLQGIEDGVVRTAVAHHLPERIPVLVRGTALLVRDRLLGAGRKDVGRGRVHLALEAFRALLTVDGDAEVVDLLLHTLVGRSIFGGHHAVRIGVFVQKGLGLVPQVAALLAHFSNLTHVCSSLTSWFDQFKSLQKLTDRHASLLRSFRGFLRFRCFRRCRCYGFCSRCAGSARARRFGAINPCLNLLLGLAETDLMTDSSVDDPAAQVHNTVNEPVCQRLACIHPSGRPHHLADIRARFLAAPRINIEDALLACAKQPDSILEVMFISPGIHQWIMDHPEGTLCHLQSVCRHGQHRCGRGGSPRHNDVNSARICANVVEHPDSSVARTAIAVEDNAQLLLRILILRIQLIVEPFRGDFIPVPHFLIDIAVQNDLSQSASLLFLVCFFGR